MRSFLDSSTFYMQEAFQLACDHSDTSRDAKGETLILDQAHGLFLIA